MKNSNYLNAFLIILMFSIINSNIALAGDEGSATFKNNCAACHAGGKNIMSPNKPIIGSSELKSKEKFTKFLSTTHGVMPSFAKIASDEPTLNGLYEYVKTLK